MTVTYVYPGNVTYILPFTTIDTTLGQFTVAIQGQAAGSGYCIGSSCHVQVSFPVNGVIETDSIEFTYIGNEHCTAGKCGIVGSGKNITTNTAFQDIVKHQ